MSYESPQNGPPRRLTRKKAKIISEDASTEAVVPTATALLKNRRFARSKGKGKSGKLEGILHIPLDVLFEILSYLLPLDILHLSRTTKQFRRVLMNKANVFIWKAARENVPDCHAKYPKSFPDMNEAQMTRLAFDPHCYVCSKPNCRTIDWELRLRICSKCVTTRLVLNSPIHASSEVQTLVFSKPGSRGRKLAYLEEVNSVKAHWATLKDAEEKATYSRQRKELKAAVEVLLPQWRVWSRLQRWDRSEELQRARDDRRVAIIEKLEELGWGPEIDLIPEYPWDDTFYNHKHVKQATRLTPRIWANIQPEMIKYMEKMKLNRLERECKTTRQRYAIEAIRAYKISLLPWTEVMPEPPDYCQFAPVKAIMELPVNVAVDLSSFDTVISQLPALLAEWRQNLRMEMLRSLQDDCDELVLAEPFIGPPSFEDVQKLPLATSAFRCLTCIVGLGPEFDRYDKRIGSVPLLYPENLHHRCLTRQMFRGEDESDASIDLGPNVRGRDPCSCSLLRFDPRASEMMETIVQFCKLDPASATPKDLDEIDVWLGCPECPQWLEGPDEAEVPVFGWRNAFAHQVEEHESEPIDWLELSVEQAEQAVIGLPAGSSKANVKRLLRATTTIEKWHCVHCMDLRCEPAPKAMEFMVQHLSYSHEITEPQLNIDYYTLVANKHFSHRTSWATFKMPEHGPRQLLTDVLSAIYCSYFEVDSTESEMEAGMKEFWNDRGIDPEEYI
ncbi:hypothetical protein HWV62_14774 [Athelia sp. TMB]|nr:hypothetical protein HWV62_14774 [Athelia sp. TMB]